MTSLGVEAVVLLSRIEMGKGSEVGTDTLHLDTVVWAMSLSLTNVL